MKLKRVMAFILSALMMLINMTNTTYAAENGVYEVGVGKLTGIVETAHDPRDDMSVSNPDIAELIHGIDKKDGKWKVMVKGLKIGETTASIKLVGETVPRIYYIKVVDGSIKDGVQRISANNLVWTPVSDNNQLGGADDFNGIFFNEFKDFNESGGPVAARKITDVKISTFDKGLIGGINQFEDIKIPQFNVGFIAQESITGNSKILINNGDVVVGKNVDTNKLDIKDGGIYKKQAEIDNFLNTAKTDLIKLNKDLWNKEKTAETKYDDSTITFDLVKGLNVLEVDFSLGRKNINFNYVNGDAKDSTIIIKVKGDVVNYNSTFLNGELFYSDNTDNLANRVIWVFDPSIEGNDIDIEIKNTILCGFLLAPNANIAFTSGYCAINGSIIANGLDASNGSTNSELHWVGRFMGNLSDKPVEETRSFKFNKKDNNEKVVSGAEFSLFKGDKEIYKAISTDEGLVSFDSIKEGRYILKETSAPDGYQISNTKVEVTVDKNGNVTFKLNGQDKKSEDLDSLYVNNVIEKKIGFSFKKIDNESNAALSNVEFKLMKDNNEIAKAKSNEDGVVNFENIELGTYTLEETAPEGYKKAGPWKINVTKEGASFIDGATLNKIENEKIDENVDEKLGSFEFKKKDNHENLVEGADFALYQGNEERIKSTSDENGLVSFTDIEAGVYTLKEKAAPNGYDISKTEIEVTVDKDGTVTFKENSVVKTRADIELLFINKVSIANFRFDKVEAGTSTGIPNVEFKLMQGNKEIAKATSNKNGIVSFNNIELGEYLLVERIPEGYKAAGPWTVDVAENGASINETKLTKIENEKLDENVDKKLGSFQFDKKDNYENIVNGAEFALYQDGIERDTAISTDTGVVAFNDIEQGTYTLKEKSAPTGYEISNAEVQVIVDSNGKIIFKKNGIVKTEKELDLLYVNKLILGDISFTKYINDKKSILTGAEFELLMNGERYGTTVFSDINGLVTFLNVKPGEYEIREVSSHSKYFKASDKSASVVIDENGVSSLVGEAKTEAETIFINKVENSIEFIKYSDNNSVLSNATFELIKGAEVIATSISDKNGVVRFENILPGEYIVREKSAPKGYIKSEATRKLVVKDNGEISVTDSEIKEWEEAFKNKAYKSEEGPIEDNNNTTNNNNEDKTTVPQTSDETNVIFPVLAAFLSLAGIFLIRKIK